MNINDWKTIQTRNDIKYIKRKLTGSSAASWSLVFDVFLLLLSFVLDNIYEDRCRTNIVWVIIAILGAALPVLFFFIGFFNSKRKESISRKVTNARELVDLFDDEICYLIMSAESFCNSLKSSQDSVDSRQKALLQEFFFIETGYYLNKAVTLILKMDNNLSVVVHEDDIANNRISKKRLVNAICLIASIYDELFQSIQMQKDKLEGFSVYLDSATLYMCYTELKQFARERSDVLSINTDKTFTYTNFGNTGYTG